MSSAGAIADCFMEMRAANRRSADMFNIDATIRTRVPFASETSDNSLAVLYVESVGSALFYL